MLRLDRLKITISYKNLRVWDEAALHIPQLIRTNDTTLGNSESSVQKHGRRQLLAVIGIGRYDQTPSPPERWLSLIMTYFGYCDSCLPVSVTFPIGTNQFKTAVGYRLC